MCLRLNTSAGATSASITVQRAALFAGVAMSKAHVTGRANTWSGATMINRRLLLSGVRGDTETVPTGSITIKSGKGSVTIPQGVNVVLVEQYWDPNGSPTETSLVGVTSGKTYNIVSTYNITRVKVIYIKLKTHQIGSIGFTSNMG